MEKGIERLKQPPYITCVEFDPGTNHLRHLLAEHVALLSNDAQQGSNLSSHVLHDFAEIKPKEERKRERERLGRSDVKDWDPVEGCYSWAPEFTEAEANDIAQSLHRYRLIAFSNFLTKTETVEKFEDRLVDIFEDAHPGCVIIVLGSEYPDIYEYIDGLAKKAGFQICLQDEEVSTVGTEIAERVFEEGERIYQHLQQLSPNSSTDPSIKRLRKYFAAGKHNARPTWMRAYRKYNYQNFALP